MPEAVALSQATLSRSPWYSLALGVSRNLDVSQRAELQHATSIWLDASKAPRGPNWDIPPQIPDAGGRMLLRPADSQAMRGRAMPGDREKKKMRGR